MSNIIDDDDGASIVSRLLFSTALDLTAKAFAQPIGVEDNWDDLGDGIVEISPQNTLRVVRQLSEEELKKKVAAAMALSNAKKNKKNAKKNKKQKQGAASASSTTSSSSDEKKDEDNNTNNSSEKPSSPTEDNPTSLLDEVELQSDKDKDGSSSKENNNDAFDIEAATAAAAAASLPDILIEDHISEEIPLVGKDSCIVWNSPTHDMSFCIMFTSECGYAAVWSAVHLLQGKSDIPSLEWDYLQSFRNMEQLELKEMKNSNNSGSPSSSNVTTGGVTAAASATTGGSPSPSGSSPGNNNNNNHVPHPPNGTTGTKKKSNSKERDGGEEPSRNTPATVPGVDSTNNNNNTNATASSGTNNNNNTATTNTEGMDDLAGSVRPAQNEESATVVIDVSESSTIEQLAQSGRERSQQQFGMTNNNNNGQDSSSEEEQKLPSDSNNTTQPPASSSPSPPRTTTSGNASQGDVHEQAFDKIAEAFAEAVRHVSSMSFVHRHCVAQSFIDGQCATTTRWGLRSAGVAQGLFSLFHPGLIFYFLDETDVFTQLVKVLSTNDSTGLGFTNKDKAEQERLLKNWTPPSALPQTSHNVDIGRSLNRAMRLSLLRHELIVPGTEECVLTFLETLQQQELHSVLACVTENEEFVGEVIAQIGNSESTPAKVEAAVRCIADVIQNAVALLPREMMMPMIARIDEAGIVDAVEKLSERILDMASKEKTSTPLVVQSSGHDHPVLKMMNALSHLFEASIVTLNSRAEEAIVGGFWRKPLLSSCLTTTTSSTNNKTTDNSSASSASSSTSPNSVNATLRLLALWSRITSSAPPSPTPSPPRKDSVKKSPMKHGAAAERLQQKYTSGLHRGGTFYLYHLCGLHDDEGHTVDRSSDPSVVADREKFQLHVATHVVPLMVQHQSASPANQHHQKLSVSPTYVLLQRTPIVTSSELTFFEGMFDWCSGVTLKKMLKSIISAPSVLPSLLASSPPQSSSSSSSAAPVATSSSTSSPRLPAHVLCARVRMIRSILQALSKTDSIFDDLLLASSSENNKDATTNSTKTGKPPRTTSNSNKSGSDSLESSISNNPLAAPTKQQIEENKAFANSIIYRLTFDFDVMNPVLTANHQATSVGSRKTPMLASAMNALLAQVKTASNLYLFRRFLRIRHSSLLPADFRHYVEQEEEQALREEIIASTAILNNNGMNNNNNSILYGPGAGNSSQSSVLHGGAGLLEHSTLSVMSSSGLPSLVNDSANSNTNNKNKGLLGSTLGLSNPNSRLSPGGSGGRDSLTNSPVNTLTGTGGLFAVADSNSLSAGRAGSNSISNSSSSGSRDDGVSPSRRPLVVDAEIPPPRSPENIPMVKRRSPSPEQQQHSHLKIDIGAMASPGKNSKENADQHHPVGGGGGNNASSTNGGNGNGHPIHQPLGSRRIISSSSSDSSTTTMLKPTAPSQPRKSSLDHTSSSSGASLHHHQQQRAGSADGITTSTTSSSTSGRRPGSRGGGRPKSGGGLRSKSPVTGLTGSSLMRN